MAFLEMTDVHKRYGGVVALDGAALSCERGEVHALIGANGSGKSTLNKILTGVVEPDRATIVLDGEPLRITSPLDAHRHGIASVYQELSVVPKMSVEANVSLALEPVRRGFVSRDEMRRRARTVLERFADAFGGRLPLGHDVGELSAGEQQIVEICKALLREPRLLVLDEATASLHKAQVDVLFDVIRELQEDDVTVVFVSHRMEEVFGLCDRATVLRNGRDVATVDLAETSQQDIVRMMVGEVEHVTREAELGAEVEQRPVVLEVRDLEADRLHDVAFDLHEGEVLGLGGLQGQGQSELLAALFGAAPTKRGSVRIAGRPVRLRHPARAVRSGLAFVPGNRAREGVLSVRPNLENLNLPSLPRRALARFALRRSTEVRAASTAVERLRIKLGSLDDPVWTLSGGNQQKIVVGKWLLTEPKVVLMDDPTKGIDVSAKEEVYAIIQELTDDGVAVLFNSSEDRELLEMSDRILIMFEGRIVEVLEGGRRTQDELVAAALRVREPVAADGGAMAGIGSGDEEDDGEEPS